MPSHEYKRRGPLSGLLERFSPGARRLHSQPFSLEDGIPVEQAYRELLRREALAPDMAELIEVTGIHRGSPEYRALRAAGVNPEAFESQEFTRQSLLKAGYIFLNTIGGGEKPLLSGSVPTPQGNLHAGDRILLTPAELEAVIAFQKREGQTHMPARTPIEALRKDMLAVLQDSLEIHEGLEARKKKLFNAAMKMIAEDPRFSVKARNALENFQRRLEGQTPSLKNMHSRYLVEECVVGIDLAHVRGVPCTTMPQRFSALSDAPSPFLDSGFHFDTNYDVTLNDADRAHTCRLNMIVVHLLSRGLNEMGASSNRSHDQRYVTAGQFEDMLYRRSAPPVEFTEKDIYLVTQRLLPRI
jgi:hypothetical protein